MHSELGEVLGSIRRSKGIKGKDLAKMLFISTTHLSRIENGQIHPSRIILNSICKYLDVSLAEVISACIDFEVDEKSIAKVLLVIKYGGVAEMKLI